MIEVHTGRIEISIIADEASKKRSRHVDVKVWFKTVITVKLVKCAGTQTVSDGLTKTFVDLFRETQGNWEHMWGSSCDFSIQTSEVDLRTPPRFSRSNISACSGLTESGLRGLHHRLLSSLPHTSSYSAACVACVEVVFFWAAAASSSLLGITGLPPYTPRDVRISTQESSLKNILSPSA